MLEVTQDSMKQTLKILGWVWGISFTAFMLATLYKSGGNSLPKEVEHYRALFQSGMEWFLSSWVFGIFFVAMWVAVSYQLSSASGWKRLSDYFSDKRMGFVDPSAFTLGSGKFGEILHNGMLKVGFGKSGVVFKVLFPFRLWHPPLYIPWQSIEKIDIQKSRVGKNSAFRKVAELISPRKYASVKLVEHPDQVILVSWKEEFRKNIPPTIMSNESNF
jgi:hypothetical protein